jgi:hypothetical protein
MLGIMQNRCFLGCCDCGIRYVEREELLGCLWSRFAAELKFPARQESSLRYFHAYKGTLETLCGVTFGPINAV